MINSNKKKKISVKVLPLLLKMLKNLIQEQFKQLLVHKTKQKQNYSGLTVSCKNLMILNYKKMLNWNNKKEIYLKFLKNKRQKLKVTFKNKDHLYLYLKTCQFVLNKRFSLTGHKNSLDKLREANKKSKVCLKRLLI